MEYEELKNLYKLKAEKYISKYGKLNIIYLRVSTDKGQDEMDQLKDILINFNLNKKECLIIKSKESAYQVWKQKTRVFNVIIDLIKEQPKDIEKNCYFWSIDRIYRNRELLTEFYEIANKNNGKIYSYIENFINVLADMSNRLPKGMEFIIDMQVKQLVNFFGWMAEMESKKRSERVKKSFHRGEDGLLYSNKGKLYGKRLKYTNGKYTKFTGEQIVRLEKTIYDLSKKRMRYIDIIELFKKKKKINMSTKYISNAKKRTENNNKTI